GNDFNRRRSRTVGSSCRVLTWHPPSDQLEAHAWPSLGLDFSPHSVKRRGSKQSRRSPRMSLEDFRGTRTIGKVTWKVERQMLITFFHFCVSRRWISTNPAKELKAPRNLKPNEVVPYTLREESLILGACEQIGGGKYNRSGAR